MPKMNLNLKRFKIIEPKVTTIAEDYKKINPFNF